MKIDQWIGEETTVDNTPVDTGLFYEQSTGYIYCPVHKDDSSLVMATYVAIVDDYGNVQPTAPNRVYRLQKEWKGYSINKPIAFCCQLALKAYSELQSIVEKQSDVLEETRKQLVTREGVIKDFQKRFEELKTE